MSSARVWAAGYHEKVSLCYGSEGCVYPHTLHYTQVIDHYERPRNVGSMNKEDSNVGTGLVGAPACGDVMKLQVFVSHVDCNYATMHNTD